MNEKLWLPMSGMMSDKKLQSWADFNSVTFHGFDSWVVPADISWEEDPFANKTWQLWFHCLTWLYAPCFLFNKTNDIKYRNYVRNITYDWMIKHKDVKFSIDSMSWDDHAVAYRSTFLIYCYLNFFEKDDEWTNEFNILIQLHASRLHSYLFLDEFYANNHGVFHCLALLNIITSIRYLSYPNDYLIDAKKRLTSLIFEMIDFKEGVTREQALEYQYISLELVDEIITSVDKFIINDLDFSLALKNGIVRMIDFAIDLRWPDESVPAVGDTWLFWKGWSLPINDLLNVYINKYYIDEDARLRLSDKLLTLNYNKYPLLNSYPGSGYHMLKGPNGLWSIFLKNGPAIHSHGHNDHLSIQFYINNLLLLVDSGGPYKYSDPNREYFTSPRAHNVVSINNNYFQPGVPYDSFASLITNDVCHLGASYYIINNVKHVRNILFFNYSKVLIVLDEIIIDSLAVDHLLVDQYWHFNHTLTLSAITTSDNAVVDNPTNLFHLSDGTAQHNYNLSIFSDSELDVISLKGRTDPNLQGWVTTSVGEMIPAPVLHINLSPLNSNTFIGFSIQDNNLHKNKITITKQSIFEEEYYIIDDGINTFKCCFNDFKMLYFVKLN